MISDFGFRIFFRLPPSPFPLCFHSCGQFAQREEAAGGGIDFIGAGPLEDDFGPASVGDFHQAGGQGVLAAQGNGGGRGVLRIGPAAIGHAGDPADQLLFSGGC